MSDPNDTSARNLLSETTPDSEMSYHNASTSYQEIAKLEEDEEETRMIDGGDREQVFELMRTTPESIRGNKSRSRNAGFGPHEYNLARFTDAEEDEEDRANETSDEEYHYDPKEKKWRRRKTSSSDFHCNLNWFSRYSLRRFKILRNFRVQTCMEKYMNRAYLTRTLKTRLPIVEWLPQYKIKDYLLTDLIAGFTVGILSLPQSMAHALLASMPPVIGLYMSLFPLLIYFFLGTSKQITINAIAIVSMLSGEVIERMVHEFRYEMIVSHNNVTSIGPYQMLNGLDLKSAMEAGMIGNKSIIDDGAVESYRLSVACSLAFLVGVIQIVLGLSGLGIIATYFSDTFVSAYTCASAFIVLISQLKSILGLSSKIKRFVGPFKTPKVSSFFLPLLFAQLLSWSSLKLFTSTCRLCTKFSLTCQRPIGPD